MKLAGLFFRNGHVGSLDRYLGTKFSGLLSWVGWFAAEWSNYSDLTQPGPPKEVAEKGKWDPLFQGNLGWWTINWMNLCVSVGLSDVAGVTKNIWGQPWLEMPGHGTMARWETSVLESQNQLYPDCFFIDANNWWLVGFRYRKNNIIHWVPGFVLAGESGEVIEVAGVCQTSLAWRHPPMEWGAIWKDAQDRYLPKWSRPFYQFTMVCSWENCPLPYLQSTAMKKNTLEN